MPPKLLTLNAPTIRTRTLIWLQNQPTVNWSTWDAVVTSIPSYHKWSTNRIIGLVITELNMEYITELLAISKKVPLVLLSQTVLSLDYDWSLFDNIINVDDLEQYPFLDPWDGSIADAVSIFALLFRYNRIVDCPNKRVPHVSAITPNETWVFTQFFKHKDKKRFLEIKECLKRNCACPHIDKIVLLNEKDYSSEFLQLPGSKIKQIVTGKRLTYMDFLMYVYYSVPKNVHVILCNADIYFEDLSDLHKINMENKMLGLLRWDVDVEGNSVIFGPRADSQDTWMFLSNSIQSHTWKFDIFNFQLGQAGCDNAFAGHILRNKFVIANPALTLKSYHLHNTNIRNYDKKDYIRSDVYINIVPTYIIDTKQETPTKSNDVVSNELVSFEVKSSSMSNEITYCTMLEKEERYKWEPMVENHYFDEIPIYKWKNVGVTTNGLVYDLSRIYKGDDDYWDSVTIDIFTPLQKCDKMFAIPFKNTDVFKNADAYIVNYISRCARLLKIYPSFSFWVPRAFEEYLEYFQWDIAKPVYFDENTACWAKEVVGILPGHELGMEDIDTLRAMYPWVETPVEKTCSIIIGSIITETIGEAMIETMSETFSARNMSLQDWSIRFVYDEPASYDALIGTSLCIFAGNGHKLWALPKGCNVIEFQQELEIHGEFQHLAHIAGLTSWVLLLSKGFVQEQIVEQLSKWIKKHI